MKARVQWEKAKPMTPLTLRLYGPHGKILKNCKCVYS